MTTPAGGYQPPVLMVALAELYQQSPAGRLPNVQIGQAFWTNYSDVANLLNAGLAELAPDGTPAPLPEPPYTANGIAGVAAGTSNASH